MRLHKLAALALLTLGLAGVAQGQGAKFTPTATPVAPDGTKSIVDLPSGQHMKNTGGNDRTPYNPRGLPGLGSGLCVFTSAEVANRWQNVGALDGFQKFMTNQPGGGWPAQLDKMIAAYCKSQGVTVPKYIQHTGGDEAFLDLAIRTARLLCVTYAGSDDFYRGPINHMVNLAHLDAKWAAIIDNNRPGKWVWMSRADFLARWRAQGGGWAVAFLASPPPSHPAKAEACACCAEAKGCICGDHCKCKAGECPNKCPVFGDCPNGRCPLVAPQPIDSADDVEYYRGPVAPGEPPTDEHEWAPFDDGGYGWRLKIAGRITPNYGIDPSKIYSGKSWTLPNGVRIRKDEAHGLLTDLVDDSDRWHLTFVGGADATARFRADVAALPKGVADKLHVQCYGPTDWPVAFFALSDGASLRKPGRDSVEVGAVASADYSAAKLDALLAPVSGKKPLEPKPEPAPEPKPVPDVQPMTPPANPAPAPPQSTLSDTLFALFTAAVSIFLNLKSGGNGPNQ